MRKYLACLIVLEITLALGLTFWREHFWAAVSTKNSSNFLEQLAIFTCVALVMCIVSGVSGYLVSLTAIKWREKLNTKAMYIIHSRELGANYGAVKPIENLSQRVQEDCASYPQLMLTLGFGGIKAITYIIVFSVAILYGFNYIYLLILLTYTIVGTGLAKLIAKPLIKLNYEQQRIEATYRTHLNVDNVNMKTLCVESFNKCVHVMLGLAKKQKHLTYFQQLFAQVGVVIPFIIIAPEYFVGSMLIGELMRFNSTASTILDNMSFTITSFGDINKLLSCRKRLVEAEII